MENSLAPVALFVYSRLSHLKLTVNALQSNELSGETELYIFSDGPKDESDGSAVKEVRDWLPTISGFKKVEIREAIENKGLAASIINGVTEIIQDHGKVIVFEDDIVCNADTLKYFNSMLNDYSGEKSIYSISAYSPPPERFKVPPDYEYDIFFVPRMMCWGWATWKDRWEHADWNVKDYDEFVGSTSQYRAYSSEIGVDSYNTLKECVKNNRDVWASRWVYTHYKHRAVCLCPVRSYVDNIGNDGSGTNCGNNSSMSNDISVKMPDKLKLPTNIYIDPLLLFSFNKFYNHRNLWFKISDSLVLLNKKTSLFMHKIIQMFSDSLLKLFTEKTNNKMVYLGTDYGGWFVPESLITSDDVVVSAGAGEDISFDLELAVRYGCSVHLLDPTPRSIKHFEFVEQAMRKGVAAPINNSDIDFYTGSEKDFKMLTFHPIGLWDVSGSMRFFVPENDKHVSHSIDNLHGTDEYFVADVLTFSDFCNKHSINKCCVLKMDIEGAEYKVINQLLGSENRPKLLLVEFHPGKSRLQQILKLRTLFQVLRLRAHGYKLIMQNGWDFVFQFGKSSWKSPT